MIEEFCEVLLKAGNCKQYGAVTMVMINNSSFSGPTGLIEPRGVLLVKMKQGAARGNKEYTNTHST